MNIRFWSVFFAILGVVTLLSSPALAEGAVNWGMYLQTAASSSAARIYGFHGILMVIIITIAIFVTALLAFVILRFNKKANPSPSNVTHNVFLEIVWTVIPVIILIIIAIPSFKVLYKNDRIEEPEMTLKITGYQWYWGYEYPDQGGISFNSYMVPTEDLKEGQKRLLSTDNVVVLPVDTNISILVTANDVIHSWAIPAFGVKLDAVPGRMNETWFNISKPGIYYGQCSELCGKDHAYMPIEVHAVSKEEFKAWVAKAKEEFSLNLLDSGYKINNVPVKITALAQQVKEITMEREIRDE